MKEIPNLVVCTHASCMQDWEVPQNLMDTIGGALEDLRGQVRLKQKKCLKGCATQEKGPFVEVSDNGLKTRISVRALSPIQIAKKVRLIINKIEE